MSLEAIPDDAPEELGSERIPEPRSAKVNAPAARSTPSAAGRRPLPSNRDQERATSRRSSATKEESRLDPATETALKRRIQTQAEEALGGRARSVEVRLNGRSVRFRAHASRFWYRWSVRRTLESLPLPAGYHGRVEAVD